MCGIIGYIGNGCALKILLDGLKRLEYRGYDSAGISIMNGKKIITYKTIGMVEELVSKLKYCNINSTIGIAHTRWATHGMVNIINAHPHLDCKNKIAVVHNGIIENYVTLKRILKNEGHEFVSDTDTEVLPHLIEKFYKGDLESAVASALKHVKGTYGIAVMHADEEKIVAARKGSSIVVGMGDRGNFVSSDAVSLAGYVRNIIYLDDFEIAVVARDRVEIKDMRMRKLKKNVMKMKYSVSNIGKQGYKHFMLKEICEQPQSLKNMLSYVVNNKIRLPIKVNTAKLDRIVITACGTSWHAGLIGKYLLERYVRIPVEVDYASEFIYRDPVIDNNTLVIVISQSGETADTLSALRIAKSRGAKTLAIVNTIGSTIAREADEVLYLNAGPEIGVAATKTFSSEILAMLLFSLYLAQKNGLKIEKDIMDSIKKTPKLVKRVIENKGYVKRIASLFASKRNFLYLGRGINFPVALEGALKLKEISYIHAEGYPAAEMKHGPIALIDKDMPTVFIANKNGAAYKKIIGNMEEVKSRGGIIITLATDEDEDIATLSDHIIYIPKILNELSPILNVIPLQFLAYYIADMKNLNVDRPRNLAKSVTVE
ncbi:MAG TPA: glutamine--fructose-6-phosphate transaminase (isomerizing) [Candidatus Aenigmarchaeota archaeon]|nr:glutamine--fructose-6-phosphate transaminase (isomerizing) [Candidatus Aenigmarchaeota archaeon]